MLSSIPVQATLERWICKTSPCSRHSTEGIRELKANTTSTEARTSSENVTSRFCNHFSIIQSHYAWKVCHNFPGACFSKVSKLFGRISGDIILFCIFKTKASGGTKLCSYFCFYSLCNIWKDQLYRISRSYFIEWLFGPEKFSGHSRNGPLELNWNQRLGHKKTKLNICHHRLTSSTQLQNKSFHVLERTRTSSKCQKMKNERARRAKILFSIVKHEICGFCCRRRGCLSSL